MKFESTYDFIFLLLLKFNFIHNSGEPAAVVGPKIQIKVEAFHPTKSAAAGLLFCWSVGRGFIEMMKDRGKKIIEKRIQGALLNSKLYPRLYVLGPRPSKIRRRTHERS
jgi:hypothetical protein